MSVNRQLAPWISNQNPALFLARVRSLVTVALHPIVDAQNGRTIAFESLVREIDKIGFSSIFEFFNNAHSIGALLELEQELQRKAIAAFSQTDRDPGTILFLNLDARLSEQMTPLCAGLEVALREGNLTPSDVCVELSECHQNLAVPSLELQVAALRQKGFRVAVDDYGAGSAGLRMLYQGNPDFLKIDRFFVAGMETDAKKRLFVSSVVDLAHTLGVSVIAEGVETLAELRCCRDARCDLVQGYFVAYPTVEISHLRRVYAHVAAPTERPEQSINALEIRSVVEPYETLLETTRLIDVLKAFRNLPNQTSIPIVDAANYPRGIVREIDIKPFLHSPFGRDLLANPASIFELGQFLHPVPIANIDSNLLQLVETYHDRLQDGIVVVEGRRYLGYLSSNALVKIINSLRLDEARGSNPLTRLPGNESILDFINQACGNVTMERLFCYFDFDNFKPFNDAYGFRVGDRAILMFRDILAKACSSPSMFCGHVGGDDFFAGAIGNETEKLAEQLFAIREAFAHRVSSLYSSTDRARGYIEAVGRFGENASFPLMTCSIASLHLSRGVDHVGVEEVTQSLAVLKQKAKSLRAGIAEVTVNPRLQTTESGADCQLAWAS